MIKNKYIYSIFLLLIYLNVPVIANKVTEQIVINQNRSILKKIPNELVVYFFESLIQNYVNQWNNIFNFEQEFDKEAFKKDIKSIRLTCTRFKTLLDKFLIKITLNSIHVHLYKLLDNEYKHLSIKQIKLNLIKLLSKVDINKEDLNEITKINIYGNFNIKIENLLYLAVKKNNINVINLLIIAGNNINKYLDNCLRNAAIHGHKEIIEKLLKLGANINNKDINGHTALTWAIFHGQIKTVKVFIKNGANLNIRDKRKGYTPLIWAIRLSIGNKNQTMILIVKLLIEEGADFNLTDKKGYNALNHALDIRNYDIVKVIGTAKSDKLYKKIESILKDIKL